ncbi:hypothetical protein CC78DRAFT_597612 [Lojkania enalia]|uniref:Uncharacterized protein n=1 Tax=Lojkania enalia TaxID=147567 RepID=A0A9P4N5J9_9PLEO|nr:hypothetical protein CC78DRAFT_597612 [Didymosphaeria enalia]
MCPKHTVQRWITGDGKNKRSAACTHWTKKLVSSGSLQLLPRASLEAGVRAVLEPSAEARDIPAKSTRPASIFSSTAMLSTGVETFQRHRDPALERPGREGCQATSVQRAEHDTWVAGGSHGGDFAVPLRSLHSHGHGHQRAASWPCTAIHHHIHHLGDRPPQPSQSYHDGTEASCGLQVPSGEAAARVAACCRPSSRLPPHSVNARSRMCTRQFEIDERASAGLHPPGSVPDTHAPQTHPARRLSIYVSHGAAASVCLPALLVYPCGEVRMRRGLITIDSNCQAKHRLHASFSSSERLPASRRWGITVASSLPPLLGISSSWVPAVARF